MLRFAKINAQSKRYKTVCVKGSLCSTWQTYEFLSRTQRQVGVVPAERVPSQFCCGLSTVCSSHPSANLQGSAQTERPIRGEPSICSVAPPSTRHHSAVAPDPPVLGPSARFRSTACPAPFRLYAKRALCRVLKHRAFVAYVKCHVLSVRCYAPRRLKYPRTPDGKNASPEVCVSAFRARAAFIRSARAAETEQRQKRYSAR